MAANNRFYIHYSHNHASSLRGTNSVTRPAALVSQDNNDDSPQHHQSQPFITARLSYHPPSLLLSLPPTPLLPSSLLLHSLPFYTFLSPHYPPPPPPWPFSFPAPIHLPHLLRLPLLPTSPSHSAHKTFSDTNQWEQTFLLFACMF